MTLKRAKTSKEIDGEQKVTAAERKLQKAKQGLCVLRGQLRALEEFPKMGKLQMQIQEHINWLVAEDEGYMQAAAELFADGAMAKIDVGYGPYDGACEAVAKPYRG